VFVKFSCLVCILVPVLVCFVSFCFFVCVYCLIFVDFGYLFVVM